jgi:hypothetical protein
MVEATVPSVGIADFVIDDHRAVGDLDRRRADLDGIDHAELAQVADVVEIGAHDGVLRRLRARSEAQPVEQVRRRLVAELGVVLDVQMVVLIALPGVHGGGESRDKFGRRHARHSL